MAKTVHDSYTAEVKTTQQKQKKYEYMEARIKMQGLEGWESIPVWGGSDVVMQADGTLVMRFRREIADEEES